MPIENKIQTSEPEQRAQQLLAIRQMIPRPPQLFNTAAARGLADEELQLQIRIKLQAHPRIQSIAEYGFHAIGMGRIEGLEVVFAVPGDMIRLR